MITFSTDDGQLGTADLKDGKLVGSSDPIQQMIDVMCNTRNLRGQAAYDFFKDWSNGYITSKEGKVASEGTGSGRNWGAHRRS